MFQEWVEESRKINNIINVFKAQEVVFMDFDLSGYKPEKIEEKSGFDVVVTKNQVLTCNVNYARIEEYQGDKEEFKGREFFRYELEVVEDPQGKYVGRRFWKSVDLSDVDKLKKLADSLYTAFEVEFSNKAELELVCAKMAGKQVGVRAWGWKPDKDGDEIQMHSLKPVPVEKESGKATVSF